MKTKKKKAKKGARDLPDRQAGVPKRFAALAKLTSSNIVEQVKMGMSRIAPLEPEDDSRDFTA